MNDPSDLNKFFQLIEKTSHPEQILSFFDRNKNELLLNKLCNEIHSLETNQKILLQFFSAAWLNDNKFGFDLFEAVQNLDVTDLQIIANWTIRPIKP